MSKNKITIGIEFDVSRTSGADRFARFLISLANDEPALVEDILDRLKAEADKRGIEFPKLTTETK